MAFFKLLAFAGGAALFAMALGMGVPLLVVGTSAGALLPKAGPWMVTVNRFFGVVLLGVALYLVSSLVPPAVYLLGWAALLIVFAIYLHAIDPLPADAPPGHCPKCLLSLALDAAAGDATQAALEQATLDTGSATPDTRPSGTGTVRTAAGTAPVGPGDIVAIVAAETENQAEDAVEAIIVGDLNDPDSKAARMAQREPVAVRRPEKETHPKVFYKGASQVTLDPLAATRPEGGIFMWSEQPSGPHAVTSGAPAGHANSSAAAAKIRARDASASRVRLGDVTAMSYN